MTNSIAITETAVRQHTKLIREMGKVVMGLLADSAVEDIALNPDGKLWCKRQGSRFEHVGRLTPIDAESAIRTIATIRGTTVNHDAPVLETELPIDGSRFEGLLPPVVQAPAFAIRKRASKVFTLADYTSAGILTRKEDALNRQRKKRSFFEAVEGMSHEEVLHTAISWKLNILVVGATGSGKTTLGNGILLDFVHLAPNDRIVSIEDTTELQCRVANSVALQAVGKVSMRDCLRAALRLKPDRIIVGEVRGGEAHDLLKAWNTGHPGGIATIHADDAESGLRRLESLVGEATAAPQQRLIAEAVNLVLFIDEEPSIPAGRKVREICLVTGFSDGKYLVEHV